MKIETAEMVLPCVEFEKNLNFFVDELRFRVDSIFPADDPRNAVISGYGLRLRLEQTDFESNENLSICIKCDSPEMIAGGEISLVAPNGLSIEVVENNPPLVIPDLKPSFVINKLTAKPDWIKGRAGMRYRDLIPDRLGGYVIASHIQIPKAGPVPDYVHFHKVQFQVIYCYKGWVKVVYEDQGEPFVMNAGDCVLQPPEIRHRVLECSENLEVIELSSPAEHITYADHELILPNSKLDPGREFNGQRFVRHIAKEVVWGPWRTGGFECRDTGIREATKGFAEANLVRVVDTVPGQGFLQNDKFLFMYVLKGGLSLRIGEDVLEVLNAADSFVIPKGASFAFSHCSDDLEVLEVKLLA